MFFSVEHNVKRFTLTLTPGHGDGPRLLEVPFPRGETHFAAEGTSIGKPFSIPLKLQLTITFELIDQMG